MDNNEKCVKGELSRPSRASSRESVVVSVARPDIAPKHTVLQSRYSFTSNGISYSAYVKLSCTFVANGMVTRPVRTTLHIRMNGHMVTDGKKCSVVRELKPQ